MESTVSSSVNHRNNKLNFSTVFNPTRTLIVVLIVISFFSGYLFFKSQSLEKGGGSFQQPEQTELPKPNNVKVSKPTIEEHWRGSKDAKFVMVEYSDLECPFCKSLHPTLTKLLDENQGKVAWVFRHYSSIPEHKKSLKLAEAIECATDQGGSDAFWKMTDAIYEKMPDLELAELAGVAKSAGLNDVVLQSCLDANKFESKVKAEQAKTDKIGFRMTPSTVIYNLSNDKTLFVEDDVPYDQFKTQLEAFMK